MDRTCEILDNTCDIVRLTLGWVSRLDRDRVAYIEEDRTRVTTGRRPLLEIGLH